MPPPPPPSASYNLAIVDSSDEENEGAYSVNNAHSCNSLPRADRSRGEVGKAEANGSAGATGASALGSTEGDDGDDASEDDSPAAEADGAASDVRAGDGTAARKKKKKKSKKKKKKSEIERPADEAASAPTATAAAGSRTEAKRGKSVAFGTVSVREYARTLGTHAVPADGGWPLGLGALAFEHARRRCLRRQNGRPSSPKHHHHKHLYHGWLVEDFESRRRIELGQRYERLIREQRRRNFEKEWEKRNMNKFHASRKKKRSCGGGGAGGSSSGSLRGSSKLDMTCQEKEEMERLCSRPVEAPKYCLETRQYDYRPRIKPAKVLDPGMTEEEELVMNCRGRNPLFGVLSEEERRKRLLGDYAWFRQCHEIDDDGRCRPSDSGKEEESEIDLTDPTIIQHIQHDLETLRIQRSATNLGCSCRKLHVFIPGATDRSHHKKKGSHRRLPERKVREELRRRGLSAEGNREKMEKALHDAVEKEPCCWGSSCPCAASGIGCQADTCSCWHPSHEGSASGGAKRENSEARSVVDQDVKDVEERCGNVNGMYVVNFGEIRRYRERYVGVKGGGVEVGAKK